MSQKEKRLARLLEKPRDFTYDEATALLCGLQFKECNGGKTSGSAVSFFREIDKRIIRLHKPHPGNTLKSYQIQQLIDALTLYGDVC